MTFTAQLPVEIHRGHRQTRPFTERAICVALAVGIAIQVAQRFALSGHDLSEYGRSLWYVTYQHGFVRRGLAGELLRTLVGGTPSVQTADLAQNLLALAMLLATIAVVVTLCRLRTVAGYLTAGVLVIAPFAFDSLGGQRRPDMVGFLLLAAVAIWVSRARVRPMTLAVVSGVALAVSGLVSEVSPLIVGPWLVLMVGASARGKDKNGATPMAVTALPSALVMIVLAIAGRPSSATVVALEDSAPEVIRGHGSIFVYLGDTFGGSLKRVIQGPSRIGLSIVIGALLCALLLWCVRAALPHLRDALAWILPTARARRTWVVGTVLAAALLFALGLDTLRWITAVGLAALLATAGVVAMAHRSVAGPPGRDRWRHPVPQQPALHGPAVLTVVVATYLLLLPPLPNWIRSPDAALRLLLDVPR